MNPNNFSPSMLNFPLSKVLMYLKMVCTSESASLVFWRLLTQTTFKCVNRLPNPLKKKCQHLVCKRAISCHRVKKFVIYMKDERQAYVSSGGFYVNEASCTALTESGNGQDETILLSHQQSIIFYTSLIFDGCN